MSSEPRASFGSIDEALFVLQHSDVDSDACRAAETFLFEHAPAPLRAHLDAITKREFADLTPSHVMADGEPAYDVPTLARYFGVSEQEVLDAARSLGEDAFATGTLYPVLYWAGGR